MIYKEKDIILKIKEIEDKSISFGIVGKKGCESTYINNSFSIGDKTIDTKNIKESMRYLSSDYCILVMNDGEKKIIAHTEEEYLEARKQNDTYYLVATFKEKNGNKKFEEFKKEKEKENVDTISNNRDDGWKKII